MVGKKNKWNKLYFVLSNDMLRSVEIAIVEILWWVGSAEALVTEEGQQGGGGGRGAVRTELHCSATVCHCVYICDKLHFMLTNDTTTNLCLLG